MRRLSILFLIATVVCSCSTKAFFAVDKKVMEDVQPILDTMSIRHKVAQLFFVDVYPGADSIHHAKEDSIITKEQVGGIIYMEGSIQDFVDTYQRLQSEVSIPLTTTIDGEFGVGMRVSEFRKYPRQGYLAQLSDKKLIKQMGTTIASDMKALKIDVNFAPVVDVNLHPDVNLIGMRSFGPDKKLVAEYGSVFAMSMQKGGTIACAKHFPGHGDTEVDSHKALPVLNFDLDRIHDIELYPFRRLVKDGVGMVMIGHLLVPALDTLPASVSHKVITELLRDEMGFDGIITTDALNMKGVLEPFDGSYEKATLAAYQAGVDILLMPKNITEGIDLIVDFIGNDPQKIADLDKRVSRVLAIKSRNGLLSPSFERSIDASAVDTVATRDLVLKMESMINMD